ncbi:MAG: alpha/beta fold hydrolase [Clostridia bacterium]
MENFVNSNGIKLWTDIRGNNVKGYVMLCNGGPGCCDYMLDVSQMMEDGYSVIRFEQRGCGRSDADENYDIGTALMDLETIRAFYHIDKWIIGGHSWGANLALFYALEYPQFVESVLYIAGNGLQRNREWSAAYHVRREEFGDEIQPEQIELNGEANRQGNQSYRQYIQRPTLYKDISKLTMRMLFMCAENDLRPNWPAEQIFNLVSNGKMVYIKGAGHYIWLSQKAEMERQLRSFLGLKTARLN